VARSAVKMFVGRPVLRTLKFIFFLELLNEENRFFLKNGNQINTIILFYMKEGKLDQ